MVVVRAAVVAAIAAGAAGLAGAAAGCAGAPSPHARAGRLDGAPRPVVVATHAFPRTWSPLAAVDRGARELMPLLYPELIALDPVTGEAVPGLAERWQWSPDGATLTLTMRADARWSDGTAVTARDAAATLAAARNVSPASVAPLRIAAARAAGDRELVVRLAQADCRVLVDLTLGVLPAAVARAAEAARDPWTLPAVPATAPTTGPFRIAGVEPDVRIDLLPGSPGAGSTAAERGLTLLAVPHPSAALAALFAGRVDVASVRPRDVAHVQREVAAGAQVRLTTVPGADVVVLAMNLADPERPRPGLPERDRVAARAGAGRWSPQPPHPVLGRVEVRQAVAHAIDYGRLIDRAVHGHGRRVPADVPPAAAWAFASSLVPPATDLPAARERLSEAGWVTSGHGDVRRRAGRPLEARLLVSRGNQAHETAAAVVAQGLAEVGFAVEVQRLEYGSLLAEVLGQRFDMALLTLRGGGPDPDPGRRWSREGDVPGRGPNFTSLASPELERALAAARYAPGCEPAARAAAYHEAQALLQALLPVVPLYSPSDVVAHRVELGAYRPGVWSPYALFAEPAATGRPR